MTSIDDNTPLSKEEVKKLKNNEYMRLWRKKNAEKNRAYNKQYAEENKEKWKEYRKRDNAQRDKEQDKIYHKEWRTKNKEKLLQVSREHYDEHREKKNQEMREYRARNPEKMRAKGKIRRTKINKGAESAKRRAFLLRRIPPWADLKAIDQIYRDCRRISKETGIKHHVDHIVPLKGRTVSGLHVAENLQIIPAIDNLRKHCNFENDKFFD